MSLISNQKLHFTNYWHISQGPMGLNTEMCDATWHHISLWFTIESGFQVVVIRTGDESSPVRYLGTCTNKITSNILDSKVQGVHLGTIGPRWAPCWQHESGMFFIYGHHRGCLNNHIFSNLGLCAACWAHFMCHHELRPTSVSHPFFSFNSSLGFAGGKHDQKITIPIFILVLQNFAIPGCIPDILFYRYLFSLLSSAWFVIAVCGSLSVQGTS